MPVSVHPSPPHTKPLLFLHFPNHFPQSFPNRFSPTYLLALFAGSSVVFSCLSLAIPLALPCIFPGFTLLYHQDIITKLNIVVLEKVG
jgi:hypothetical protein